jgi:hypothetical protein
MLRRSQRVAIAAEIEPLLAEEAKAVGDQELRKPAIAHTS